MELPKVSTSFKCDEYTSIKLRLKLAKVFLAGKEFDIVPNTSIECYNTIENIFIHKVYTYAIAYAGGATNGKYLFAEAVRDLITWRAIFNGACYVSGQMVDCYED